MALISLTDDPLDYFRPSRQWMDLDDDLLAPFMPRRLRRMVLTSPYNRLWKSKSSQRDKGSTVALDKNKFQVSLDVQQFTPEEISVKVTGDNTITVEGKHEEKEDEHGFISRHFVRKYTLPEGHNVDMVRSKLSSDGVLTITAPKLSDNVREREIPIALTGQPSQAIENVENGDCQERQSEKVEKEETTRKRR